MSNGSKHPRNTPQPPPEAEQAPAAGEARVIRDAEGVIVGARGAGPKILGVIDIKPKTPPRSEPAGKRGRGDGRGGDGKPRESGARPGRAEIGRASCRERV